VCWKHKGQIVLLLPPPLPVWGRAYREPHSPACELRCIDHRHARCRIRLPRQNRGRQHRNTGHPRADRPADRPACHAVRASSAVSTASTWLCSRSGAATAPTATTQQPTHTHARMCATVKGDVREKGCVQTWVQKHMDAFTNCTDRPLRSGRGVSCPLTEQTRATTGNRPHRWRT
jgi:hypothetical protein